MTSAPFEPPIYTRGAFAEPEPLEIRARGTWDLRTNLSPSFVEGEELADLADHDDRIVVLTADLAYSNGTHVFQQRHPDRFFNMGIAEQNMVSVGAGLASAGKVPYVSTFASFVGLLAIEQIRTDLAYPRMPVRILAHHSGITMGFYGTSHHALEDLATTRAVADLPVVCATDAAMLRAILRFSTTLDGPLYIRMGRGRDPDVYREPPEFALGRSWQLRDGADLALLATGSEVAPCLDAADRLAERGVSARVVDFASVDPLDSDAVLAAATDCSAVLTVEEHNVTGGLGSAVASVLADNGVATRFRRHGIYDTYVDVGPPAALYAHYRLDGPGVAAVATELLDGCTPTPVV
jgi:transketolase